MTSLILSWLGLTSAVLLAGFLWAGDTAIAELTTREVDVKLHSNFDIVPDVIEVAQYTDLVLNVENIDTIQHDLQVTPQIGTSRLKPGEQVVLPVGYLARDVTIWCSIKGHREQGMQALITIYNDEPISE